MALAGAIFDNTLTGIITLDRIPFLALASISGGGNYYWAKALSLKIYTAFFAVQFSTDGSLLIAHSSALTNNYIVVFNVNSGEIISARSYLAGGYQNYNF
jgi:hypothetical protein